MTRYIPNTITLLNLLSGCLAVFAAFHTGDTFLGLCGTSWVYILIGMAAVFDFCDGFAARLLKAYSDIGAELDSLSDLVSFGVAPAMLMLNIMMANGAGAWSFAAMFIPMMGALRLAKFNVDTTQTTTFSGLPIPANAIFWIGYSALCYAGASSLAAWYVVLPVIVVESWLMVSPIHLFSLKFKTWGWKGNQWRWLLIVTAPVLVFCMGVPGLMWLIVAYVAYGLVSSE